MAVFPMYLFLYFCSDFEKVCSHFLQFKNGDYLSMPDHLKSVLCVQALNLKSVMCVLALNFKSDSSPRYLKNTIF